MKNVILTGSSGGIGTALLFTLEKENYRVITLESRLEDFASLEKEVKGILKNNDVDVLINCAGLGVFEPHEEIPSSQIIHMINVNLTAALLLVNLTLRSLKKSHGHIINISSIEATRHSKFSALYTATKSGLRAFSLSLFEELRKSSVRVTSINPDITDTGFFDSLSFSPSDDPSAFLSPKVIAETVLTVLRSDGVITDLTIRPQRAGVKKKKKLP